MKYFIEKSIVSNKVYSEIYEDDRCICKCEHEEEAQKICNLLKDNETIEGLQEKLSFANQEVKEIEGKLKKEIEEHNKLKREFEEVNNSRNNYSDDLEEAEQDIEELERKIEAMQVMFEKRLERERDESRRHIDTLIKLIAIYIEENDEEKENDE